MIKRLACLEQIHKAMKNMIVNITYLSEVYLNNWKGQQI